MKLLAILLSVIFLASCQSSQEVTADDIIQSSINRTYSHPKVEIITSKGNIIAELYEDKAPNTVANFISLAESGFYTDMKFHRILMGFMAQGGCPNSKAGANGRSGTGGPGYTIAEEYHRSLKHGPGMLTMARKRAPGSTGSQFCIFFTEAPGLDGQYTVFGKVIKGMDVVRKLNEIGAARDPQPPKETVRFTVKVLSKNNHPYSVKKN
ncbi:MAG: peptidylprolyl isomerase [Lentisphaerales bacterium]|nr:peptidylprolyl isomerase [Lentisphaerales bacterium]